MKLEESELLEAVRQNLPEIKILLEELSMQLDQQSGFPSKIAERAAKVLRETFERPAKRAALADCPARPL